MHPDHPARRLAKAPFHEGFERAMSLTLSNIHKAYGARTILNGVDLAVEAGEITCLIGPSGAGKTTLLRIMAGLESADRGTLAYCGHPFPFPQEAGHFTPWPDVTVVFQSLFLWPHMTLAENILLPARTRIPEGELKQRFEQLIEDFDMRAFINNYPNEASLGQRQRVALARAVILRPRFLLLDEITSALDVEQIAGVLKILEKLKGQGIGMLLITHLLNFAKRASDNIVFLADGIAAEQGTPAMLAKPQTERLKQFLSLVEIAT
jgi:ABC-type polar amino acid transport system ATPase subunit